MSWCVSLMYFQPNGKFDFDFTDYDSDYTSGTMMRYTSKPTGKNSVDLGS